VTTVTRRYGFSASHRLHSAQLGEAENQRIYGKCNNLYGHGHDYTLDVTVMGEVNATTGLIVRIATLDRFVSNEVLRPFAYRNLNQDVAEFENLVPTTENLALVAAGNLERRWAEYFPYTQARLSGISMHETDRNSFEVVLAKVSRPGLGARAGQNESVIVNA
jgi:6-pyruvoyltetrahydropterin/6-carboxytetrahydropterin synthase